MKKLPQFIIKGSLQELIEIEPLLVMAGYHDDEAYNFTIDECDRICLFPSGAYIYSPTHIGRKIEVFKAHEIHKILYYIETGRVKHFKEDEKFCHVFDMLEYKVTMDENFIVSVSESKSKKKTKKLINKKIGEAQYRFDDKRGLVKLNPSKEKQIELAFELWITDPIDGSKHEYTQEQKKEILAFIKSQI